MLIIINDYLKYILIISNEFFNIGLHHDDVLQENDDVKEALRRLPADKVDERSFRIMRAMQLSLQKIELPKEEWTKFEEVNIQLYK